MKILLDENLPTKLKYDFGEGYEVITVRDRGWLGKMNGELLANLFYKRHQSTSKKCFAHPGKCHPVLAQAA